MRDRSPAPRVLSTADTVTEGPEGVKPTVAPPGAIGAPSL
jgi:hypothetical protein